LVIHASGLPVSPCINVAPTNIASVCTENTVNKNTVTSFSYSLLHVFDLTQPDPQFWSKTVTIPDPTRPADSPAQCPSLTRCLSSFVSSRLVPSCPILSRFTFYKPTVWNSSPSTQYHNNLSLNTIGLPLDFDEHQPAPLWCFYDSGQMSRLTYSLT